jgi:hypothetical protein
MAAGFKFIVRENISTLDLAFSGPIGHQHDDVSELHVTLGCVPNEDSPDEKGVERYVKKADSDERQRNTAKKIR